MAVAFRATDYILLTGFDNGNTLSWSFSTPFTDAFDVIDTNNDGDLDTGIDNFQSALFSNYSGYVVEYNGNDYAIFKNTFVPSAFYVPFDIGVDNLFFGFPFTGSTSKKVEDGTAANFCFLGGTWIATPSGEALVEQLRIGDLIRTADGRAVPVTWVGRQRVGQPVNVTQDTSRAPVCIAAGVLGTHSDLYVSADHGMIVAGHVITAAALVNGETIRFVGAGEMPSDFTYYHIETEAHDVILANGAAAETFIDAADRKAFDNYQEYLHLYGADRIIPQMPMPRISTARLLPQQVTDRILLGQQTRVADVA